MGVVAPLVGSGHVIEDEEHKTLSDEDADFSTWTLKITSMDLVNYSLMTVYYPPTFPVDTFLLRINLAVIHLSLSRCTKRGCFLSSFY